MLNYEEGGEHTPLEGDPASEAFLHEVVGAPPTVGRRNLNTESMFEYGSRAGFWRVHRIFTAHGLPLTVYAVGQALERNPEAARAMVDAGWEVASHGWRWIDYGDMPEEEERDHLRRAIEAIERACGTRPVGWYTGRVSERTRRLVVEEGGFLYDSDSYADELPYWVEVDGQRPPGDPVHARRERLQVPAPGGFVTADDFPPTWSTRSTGCTRREDGCCRSASTAGSWGGPVAPRPRPLPRARRAHEDVWVATRADIARHWHAAHPACETGVMRIAVVGAGAMGSVYAGLLGDAGNEVWAVDPWDEHVRRSAGSACGAPGGDRVVRSAATTDPGEVGIVDLVVIATKAMDVRDAATPHGRSSGRRPSCCDPERPRLGRRGGRGPRRRPRPARRRGRLRASARGARARRTITGSR